MTIASTTTEVLVTPSRTWTREDIYLHPERGFDLPPDNFRGRFTEEFKVELARETKWVAEETMPALDRAHREPVGRRLMRCPVCDDEGYVWLLHRGETTGVPMYRTEKCLCEYFHTFWVWWARVPERFRQVHLNHVAPIPNAKIGIDRQAKIIEALRAKPNDSYYLFGPPGTGKTHLSFALYRWAAHRNAEAKFFDRQVPTHVWRIGANALLQECVDWEMRDRNDHNCAVPAPTVSRRLIERVAAAGYAPSLYLDELDKIKPSEFKLATLCDIIDAIYEAKGQLVVTSNKSLAELSAKWGSDEAESIVRRIGGDQGGHTVYFGD
jgi:hypothetical protein